MCDAAPQIPDQRSLIRALVADGRPLLSLTALCLIFSGLFVAGLMSGPRGATAAGPPSGPRP